MPGTRTTASDEGAVVSRAERTVPRRRTTDDRHTVIDLNADLAEGYGRWVLTDDEAMPAVGLHGDTPGAVELAKRVRAALEAAGIRVEAFA